MKKTSVQVIALVIFGVGLFLRLFLLRDQIPLNDDWHGLIYAATHSLSELLESRSTFAHTSPLMNVYRWFLLHSVGWSELLLSAPSVFAGILSLLIFPQCVRKAHGNKEALIFSGLLALSPLLIFYSRIGRPYGPLVFCLFLSLYSGGFWVLTNQLKYLALYICSSILAVYLHPVAVVTVFAPLFAGGACVLLHRKSVRTPLLRICLVGGLLGLICFLLLRPATTMTGSVMVDNPLPDFATWKQLALMFLGTSGALLAFGLLCVAACGALILLRKSLFWGGMFLGVFVLNLLAIWIGRFALVHAAIVLARYLIILCPIILFWVAIALSKLFSVSRIAGVISCVGVFFLLAATSPLWNTYRAPNNFTNHSAFQESYEPAPRHLPRRSKMFPKSANLQKTTLPDFYQRLPADADCIIEYPMMLGDLYNLNYFYQQHHRKRVVVGYTMDVPWEHDRTDGVYSRCLMNHVFCKIPFPSRLRFRSIVNIYNAEAVEKTGADYLVIHFNLLAELYNDPVETKYGRTPALKECLEKMVQCYGKPVYIDRTMIVFALNQEGEIQ